MVDLAAVSVLELTIQPDLSGREAVATLAIMPAGLNQPSGRLRSNRFFMLVRELRRFVLPPIFERDRRAACQKASSSQPL